MPNPDSTDPSQPGFAQILATLDRAAPSERIDLDTYTPSPSFKARITLTADGTEFCFPPMGGAAQAIGQTVVFVISLAIWILYGTASEPSMLFWASWGIIELLFFLWILRLWFAPERVVIGNGVISDTYGIFGKTRTMPTAQVTAIRAVRGGYTRHNAILIRDSGFHPFMVGDGIRDRHDAEWLALQMSRVANVKASDAHSPTAAPVAELLERVQVIDAVARAKGWGSIAAKTDAMIKSGGTAASQTSEQTARRSPLMRLAFAMIPVLIFWISMRRHMTNTIYLNDAYNGRSIHVAVGKEIHLTLIINSETGTYRTVANDSQLLRDCGSAFPNDDQADNAQQVQVLCFSAKKKGSDYLRLESRPPRDQEDIGERQVYTLNVVIE